MSDQDPGPLPELTSEQEATVRRLLAEARHDDPVPPEVADRLDRVLADLSSSPAAASAPVVDLGAHRRRRNAGALLVAAAAVIVGGFAVGQVIDVGSSDDDDAGAGSSVARQSTTGDQPGSDSGGGAADQSQAESAKAQPLQLSSQNLERDVQRQLRRTPANAGGATDPAPLSPSYGVDFSCPPASPSAYGLGRLFPALYDGQPTVLALRPATGTTQEAQVLQCGTGTPLQSVTVPAP